MCASYLPPIRRGDLDRATAQGAERILIIDGEFGQSLSVSISEIRAALRRGVEVWGASSMGALRAAECGVLGMRGVGWIYSAFREGTLTDDEEVALLFDPYGFRAITVPLVNIRWAVQHLARERSLNAEAAERVVTLARHMPFQARTLETLESEARLRGVPEMLVVTRWMRQRPQLSDRKRLDAIGLLEIVAAQHV